MNIIYKALNFPILQNKVYSSKEEAINCPKGNINITMDESGFVSNIEFDSGKMNYDTDYDNSVPSDFFKSYYRKIGDYLINKYSLSDDSLILDIGCGKGTFLNLMFEELGYKGIGIGIDPSYEGDLNLHNNNLKFIQEYFSDKHIENVSKVSLVILRHTLEHIPNPSNFLASLFEIFKRKRLKDIPIFIEVPDVDWIFENRTYWDFFYEHVNYFSKSSLEQCITNSGGVTSEIRNEFGGQYLWAEAYINSSDEKKIGFIRTVSNINFQNEITLNIEKIKTSLEENSTLVIWGMASKGIIFSLHLFENGICPKFFIDVNANKQNKFIPKLGCPISASSKLPKDDSLSIICMNPNYNKEIHNECVKLGLNFKLYTPNFDIIKI